MVPVVSPADFTVCGFGGNLGVVCPDWESFRNLGDMHGP